MHIRARMHTLASNILTLLVICNTSQYIIIIITMHTLVVVCIITLLARVVLLASTRVVLEYAY